MTTNGTNGTNGTATSAAPVNAIELQTKIARYRTALVALVALAKREGWHRHLQDTMLLEEIEWLLSSDAASSE